MAASNIKHGGYQPTSDPPAPPNGPVQTQAINPITGNPAAASGTPAGQPGRDVPPPSPGRPGRDG